jgi:polysaccharide chain length determinant protein (PEP-CTERM system associated)
MLPGKSYSPKDFVEIARQRWPLLIVPPLVTLFAALVYSSTLQNVYQSDMLIEVVPQRVPDDFVRSTVTLRTEERLSAIQVQIMSRSVLEPLILEFDLYPEERSRLPMEDVVQKLRTAVQVYPAATQSLPTGPETTAFRVSFTYTDPEVAARVTHRLGSIFVDENARDRASIAKGTDDFLKTQLASALQRLEEQERQVEEFRQQHGTELPTLLQSNLQAMQSTYLQVQGLVEAIARDRDRKLTLERLYHEAANEPVAAPPSIALQGQPGALPVSASKEQQLAAARAALAGLERRLMPEHPDISNTKRAIKELEQQVADEKKNAPGNPAAVEPAVVVAATPAEAERRERLRQMKSELESLERLMAFKEAEERRLRDQLTEYQRRIEAVPGIESEWVALTRNYESTQQIYNNLLAKSEASNVAVQLENRQISEHFRILDPARVPITPVSPIRYQISLVGLGVGAALGLALIGFLELRDSSFRAEAEVARLLSLPVLAAVPYVATAAELKRRFRIRALVWASAAVFGVAGGYVFWSMRLWTVVL